MIYLDTSVLLAQLLAEDRKPADSLWSEALVSSRLIEYEAWVRVHQLGIAASHGEPARRLLSRLSMIELSPLVLDRALHPFPAPVRTLDALHLASVEFLRSRRVEVSLATYDQRMLAAARSMDIPLFM